MAMQITLPTSNKTLRCITRATKWLTISMCLVAYAASAQTVPERPSQVLAPKVPLPVVSSMAEAVLLIQQNPKKFQIHVQDLIKGDVYCDIQSIVVDKATGWIHIQFNYRGQTRVSLTPITADSFLGTGSYLINLPILGTSDVKVNLTFSPDGSARGEWRNMGYAGAFDIVKK